MSDLTIDVKDLNGSGPAALVVLNGSIDAKTVINLKTHLGSVRDRGVQKLVLDMEHVKYVNSTGLSYLISLSDMENGQAALSLVKLQPKVKVVFDMMGLGPVFRFYLSREEAIRNLDKPAAAPPPPTPAPPPCPSAAVAIPEPARTPSGSTARVGERPSGTRRVEGRPGTVRVRAANIPADRRLLRILFVTTLSAGLALAFQAALIGQWCGKVRGPGGEFPARALQAMAGVLTLWPVGAGAVLALAVLTAFGFLDRALKVLAVVAGLAALALFALSLLTWQAIG